MIFPHFARPCCLLALVPPTALSMCARTEQSNVPGNRVPTPLPLAASVPWASLELWSSPPLGHHALAPSVCASTKPNTK